MRVTRMDGQRIKGWINGKENVKNENEMDRE